MQCRICADVRCLPCFYAGAIAHFCGAHVFYFIFLQAMQPVAVILVSLIYAGMLFTVAWMGDRYASVLQRDGVRPVVYSLALAVYCSSWTFYGAVGTAARYGLGYLPIYLGPLLMFVLGWRMLERLALVAQHQNAVSIADFLASRFGRSQRLAALVTVMALVAAVPYLALQYKAVVSSLEILTGLAASRSAWGDPAFYVAAIMALFAILFGTRQVDATEHRPGLMLAVALESIVKLVALVAVGVFALLWLAGQPALGSATEAIQRLVFNSVPTGFVGHTLLAFAAIICLPRQFHVAIVECGNVRDIRRARWWFGIYLVLISAMVLPIAAAGLAQLEHTPAIAPDNYVLALPLSLNQDALALVAYIGGFSAATGMVIVVSVALSNMVSNDLVMPLLLRWRWRKAKEQGESEQMAIANTAPLVLWVRRVAIVVLALLAYGYSQGIASHMQLASFGLMAFAAVAQFAPALFAGLYWPAASRKGVEAGLLTGFAVWAYTLLIPNFAEVGWIEGAWVQTGPFHLQWLRPHQLFGTADWDPITHSAFWSLLMNAAVMVLVSLRWRPGLTEQMQAQPFLSPYSEHRNFNELTPHRLHVQDLQLVASHIVGNQTAERAFREQAENLGLQLHADLQADRGWVHFTELLLAGAVGAASARLLLTRALQGSGMELAAVVAVLDKAGQELRFNRETLLATLENIDPGVSVVDAEMRLVAWNQRYQQLFRYPSGMLYVGRDVASLIRHNLQHNPLGLPSTPPQPENIEAEVQKRVALMRAGRSYTYVRELLDGRFIEMRGHPLPNGGYVTSYSDITDFKHAERELRLVNETLEQRVAERSREVAQVQESRSRYLTAISHDVLQPIHAARLFASALRDEVRPAHMQHLAERVDTALQAAEDLLDGVLDISRLDAGALQPNVQSVDLQALLRELHAQYAPLAHKRQLQWRLRISEKKSQALWVRSDPRLLRRVLQNFVANALRYTQRGGVLMTARIQGESVRLQVWDTGPGIPTSHLARIYEEFHRYHQVFDWDGRGLGLGLSICQRIANLLKHPLSAASVMGRGSVFGVVVPYVQDKSSGPERRKRFFANAAISMDSKEVQPPRSSGLQGLRVLCLDNDPDILQGMQELLSRWQVDVVMAATVDDALRAVHRLSKLDCLLVDYHLHDRLNGLEAIESLRALFAEKVTAVLITADGSDTLRAIAAHQQVSVLGKPVKPAALRALLTALVTGGK